MIRADFPFPPQACSPAGRPFLKTQMMELFSCNFLITILQKSEPNAISNLQLTISCHALKWMDAFNYISASLVNHYLIQPCTEWSCRVQDPTPPTVRRHFCSNHRGGECSAWYDSTQSRHQSRTQLGHHLMNVDTDEILI